MRIAITINTSWNIFNFRSGLIQALLAAGYEVYAVAPYDSYTAKLEELGCKYVPIKMQNTGVNPMKDIKLIFDLKRIYKNINPDVILQFTIKPNIYGSMAAHRLGIPVINNVSGLGTVFLSKSVSSYIAKTLYKLSFKNVPLVFFQNEDDKNDFLQEIPLETLNYDLLPGSGINLRKYTPQERMNNSTEFQFLMIARIIIEKGIREYVEAAKIVKEKNPNTKFLILGQLDPGHKRGISIDEFDQWTKEEVIVHLGETDDVKNIIASSDCVVLPSYREGTPRTLLEAAAMGKPIITSNVPGCREVVRDEFNGLLCKVKSASNLAEKMIQMENLSSKALAKMGENGRKLVEERFDENIVIEKYLKQISNFIKQKAV
ncbi:MAG: glycosyltransferase family 4 protein [Reichenbachiella sp.]